MGLFEYDHILSPLATQESRWAAKKPVFKATALSVDVIICIRGAVGRAIIITLFLLVVCGGSAADCDD